MVAYSTEGQQEEKNRIKNIFSNNAEELLDKWKNTYRLIGILFVAFFLLGVLLLFAPFLLKEYVSMDEFQLQLLVLQGFGIVDIVALFVYNPVKRIHNLIRDVSLTILVFNSYQVQLELFLKSEKADKIPEKKVGIPEKIGIETRKYIETIKDCFAEEE